jgi:hypothetical protein
MLGYNPMATLLPANVLNALPVQNRNDITGNSFYPNLISTPFIKSIHRVFYFAAGLAIIAAIASGLRGHRYIHEKKREQAKHD